jgi:hypothetical protein
MTETVADSLPPEAFKLYLYNCHCHQLFLGCPSNEEYARSLTELISGANYKGRVSLVEGLPLEEEFDYFREQDYRITQFPDVFRTTKIAPITLSAPSVPNAQSWAAPWKKRNPFADFTHTIANSAIPNTCSTVTNLNQHQCVKSGRPIGPGDE